MFAQLDPYLYTPVLLQYYYVYYNMLLVLRGTIVNRTYDGIPKNLIYV